MKKIAVILCGSGYKDGSEIRESVGVLWALSQHSVSSTCFAPDAPQADVINCLTGEPMKSESRNMRVEAARIARGEVLPLEELDPDDFDAVILPGGFGAAKNLCTFATHGSQGSVRKELKDALRKLHGAGKPIGAVCIAPAILALSFPDQKLELTLGAQGEAAQEIEKLGHRHIETQPNEAHVDRTHKVVTTPAYMYDQAPLHEIFTGIQKLVNEVITLTK